MLQLNDWVALIASTIAILAALFAGLRWVITAMMREIGPEANGTSLKAKVERMEIRVDEIYAHLIAK